MPRRRPTVGVQGALPPRLSPRVHRILRRQASRTARRTYGPQLRADRAQRGAIRRTYRQTVRGARSAINLSEGLLGTQTKALKSSGLKGRYLREAQQEFAARGGDLATSLPFLTSEARATKQSDMAKLAQTLAADRAQIHQEAATQLTSLLGKAETQAKSTLAKRTTAKQGTSKEYKAALVTARRQFDAAPLKVWQNLNGRLWKNYVDAVQGEGVTDPAVAEKAARTVAYQRLNGIYGHHVTPAFFQKWLESRIRHGR